MYVDCRVLKHAYLSLSLNHFHLFRLLLLSNASAARHHLSYYLQLFFAGDSRAMVAAQDWDPVLREINAVMSTPRELRDLCRLAIRSHLVYCAHGSGILRLLSRLPLPRSIIDYLRFAEEIKTDCQDDDDN